MDAAWFRRMAAKCRRLANGLNDQDAQTLLALAIEYEHQATMAEQRERLGAGGSHRHEAA